MEQQTRILLAIAARVLSYPSEDYKQELVELEEAIATDLDHGGTANEALQRSLLKAIRPLYQLPLQLIREHYVQTFDLKERTGLYLTAHELGDSRKRGMALIELQNLIMDAGFSFRNDELADYMPLLFEFVAASEQDDVTGKLYMRLSLATERIRQHLTDDNLYKPIVIILMDHVFEKPTTEAIELLEKAREKPDLDPMPYPLMYK